MLGSDLQNDVPNEANEKLISLSNSVVRNCIANSTIDEIIRNRKYIRDAVNKEMLEVVKGWGVWVETFEITDVKISSDSLFKDMQTKFREEMKYHATMNQLEIDNKLNEAKLEQNLLFQKWTQDTNKEKTLYSNNKNLEFQEHDQTIFEKYKVLNEQFYEIEKNVISEKNKLEYEKQSEITKFRSSYDIEVNKNLIDFEKAKRDEYGAEALVNQNRTKLNIDLTKLNDKYETDRKKKFNDQLIKQLSDNNVFKWKLIERIKNINLHTTKNGLTLVNINNKHPVDSTIKSFYKLENQLLN